MLVTGTVTATVSQLSMKSSPSPVVMPRVRLPQVDGQVEPATGVTCVHVLIGPRQVFEKPDRRPPCTSTGGRSGGRCRSRCRRPSRPAGSCRSRSRTRRPSGTRGTCTALGTEVQESEAPRSTGGGGDDRRRRRRSAHPLTRPPASAQAMPWRLKARRAPPCGACRWPGCRCRRRPPGSSGIRPDDAGAAARAGCTHWKTLPPVRAAMYVGASRPRAPCPGS